MTLKPMNQGWGSLPSPTSPPAWKIALADPVIIVQIVAMLITLGGLVTVVLNQVEGLQRIKAIQHQLEARP